MAVPKSIHEAAQCVARSQIRAIADEMAPRFRAHEFDDALLAEARRRGWHGPKGKVA